jgi:hypothetical protein
VLVGASRSAVGRLITQLVIALIEGSNVNDRFVGETVTTQETGLARCSDNTMLVD